MSSSAPNGTGSGPAADREASSGWKSAGYALAAATGLLYVITASNAFRDSINSDLSWSYRRLVIGALALTIAIYVVAVAVGVYERRKDAAAVPAALAGLVGWFILILASSVRSF